MKLSRKNLIYSMILAGILMSLVIGYFIFMLPSLYVNHISDQNLNSIKQQHTSYLKHNNYDDVSVNNPAGCFTIEVPLTQNYILFTNKIIQGKIEAKDDTMSHILAQIHETILAVKDNTKILKEESFKHDLKDKFSSWKDDLSGYQANINNMPVSFTLLSKGNYNDFYSEEHTKYHMISDDTVIVESGVRDSRNNYTNYVALTLHDQSLVVSYLPVMTPKMTEILPVVMQSIPMIATVLILLVLLFSQVYSKGIVNPIVTLVEHTKAIRFTGIKNARVPKIKGCDEVSTLAETLNQLYEELRQSYSELEDKNQMLEEENERKEVFLRASSHQLKTPIAAALLLLDGIMNQIGKYKDSKVYLPEVKKQLLSMKNIVDDILYLNHCDDNITFQDINISDLIKSLLSDYAFGIEHKKLKIDCNVSDQLVYTDYNLLYKIMDNLVANAIAYTPEQETIQIRLLMQEHKIEIINYGSHIDESMLPHIFEPFVSGNQDGKGHGLGLYIVSYYAKKIHSLVSLSNQIVDEKPAVCTVIYFDQNKLDEERSKMLTQNSSH